MRQVYLWVALASVLLGVEALQSSYALAVVTELTEVQLRTQLIGMTNSNFSNLQPGGTCSQFLRVLFLHSIYESELNEILAGSDVLLDFSGHTLYSRSLALQAKAFGIPHLLMHSTDQVAPSAIQAAFPENTRATLTQVFMQQYGWSRTALLVTPDSPSKLELSDAFDTKLLVAEGASISSLVRLVSTEIKAQGIMTAVVECNTLCGSSMLAALTQSNLSTEGRAFLFRQQATLGGNAFNGLLYLAEPLTETSTTLYEWVQSKIRRVLSQLCQSADSAQLKLLIEQDQTHLSIVNIQGGIRRIIGQVDSTQVSLSYSILFPGNSTTFNSTFKAQIAITMCSGVVEYDGSISSSNIPLWIAANAALTTINESGDILKYFELVQNSITVGTQLFDPAYTIQGLLDNAGKFGVAIIPPATPTVYLGIVQVLSQLNYTIPQVSYAFSNLVYDRAQWPWVTSVQGSTDFIEGSIFRLFDFFGWKKVCILISTWGYSTYEVYISAAASYGIEVANDESLRLFNPLATDATLDELLKPQILEIMRTNVRIVVISTPYPQIVLDAFWKYGAVEGDYVVIASYWLSDEFVSFYENESTDGRYRLLAGSGTFQQSTYVGDFGSQVFDIMTNTPGASPDYYACIAFDSAWLIGNTLDWIVRRGRNFEDNNVMQQAILNSRVTGCTGQIVFGSTIPRSLSLLDIMNYYQISETAGEIRKIGTYSPFTSDQFRFQYDYTFGHNSTANPTDSFIETYECGYLEALVIDFPNGRHLAYGVYGVISLLAAACTYMIWRKHWRRPIEALTKKEEISMDDTLFLGSIGVEFFQYLSMGPDFGFVSSLLAELFNASTVDLDSLVSLERWVFWVVLDIVLALCLVWLLAWLSVFFQVDEHVDSWVTSYSVSFAYFVLPILGNLFFLPILATTMNVFLCPLSVGPSFSDSLLAKDCYQHCWSQTHNLYVAFSLVGLLVYLPLAVLMRPAWQELQPMLHIKTLPSYLMLKTVFQIGLALLNKILKPESALAHSFVFLSCLIPFYAFISKVQPFSYPQANLWLKSSFLAIMWSTGMIIVAQLASTSAYVNIAVVFTGWCLILTTTLFLHRRLPVLLFRVTKDTAVLFRFAFTRGKGIDIEQIRNKLRFASATSNQTALDAKTCK